MAGWTDLLPTLISGYQAYNANNQQQNMQQSAMDSFASASKTLASLTPPNLVSLVQPLQQAVFLGKITPEEFVAQVQQKSQLAGIQVPQELINQQYSTLKQLNDIATHGGLTATDRAQLNDIFIQQSTQARGARDAAGQEYAMRGMGGSGMEVLRREMADQSAVGAASKQGTDVAALAQQRALQALTQGGALAGSMRTQDFSEQQAKASAQDQINNFNTQMAQQAANANTQAKNTAAQNAQAQQYNVQAANMAQNMQSQQNLLNATQNQFANQLNQANSVAGRNSNLGVYQGQLATNAGKLAEAQGSKFYGGLPAAANQIAGTQPTTAQPAQQDPFAVDYSNQQSKVNQDYSYSDEKLKTGIKELSPEDMKSVLDGLTGNKYKYGRPFKDKSEKVGIIAQDLEKTPAKDAVINAPLGKAIKNSDSAHLALAGLANVHQRLKKLES